ncbi:glycine zipper 2TM domain-containing protein [Silicimonas sp. MF1-12-2]|uniref:glycine zipper 2TM domain-containing protein n=1 Tax=Silicimonas sp. MF1-12-2 TaxID=3384793 RepID=UPI0039B5AE3A
MRGSRFVPVFVGVFLLSACQGMSPESRTVAGVAGGAAAGLILAEALHADDDWRIISALAGAAAGVLVAENMATGECAYARGDGTYYVAPCPRYRHRAG